MSQLVYNNIGDNYLGVFWPQSSHDAGEGKQRSWAFPVISWATVERKYNQISKIVNEKFAASDKLYSENEGKQAQKYSMKM